MARKYVRKNVCGHLFRRIYEDRTCHTAGQKDSVTDANGHTTSWMYTTAVWLNSEIKPDVDGSGPDPCGISF
jgi:hypothetical protein